jgi:hypothetical protein
MSDQSDHSPEQTNKSAETAEEETRPQRAGEAATTRFGMEDGDNTDVHATGGPSADEGPRESGSGRDA